MAENTITRAQALEIAIAAIKNANPDAAVVLEKMHASITTPSVKNIVNAAKNAALVAEVCELFFEKGNFQNADVRAVVDGTRWLGSKGTVSPQKVSAVLRQGVADGKLAKETVGTGSSALTFYRVL